MPSAYINQIATAVPDHDIHAKFIEYCPSLIPERKDRLLFNRMASRAQIDHRYSFLSPALTADALDADNFYSRNGFPDTQTRMVFYERHAFTLARRALDQLELSGVTHLIVTTCTGFYAPGVDHQIIDHYGLAPSVERTMVGFMGCYAALNALKLARHIVRSQTDARVLVLNLELCTLHMKPEGTLEEMLSFLIFADGCAASIVSAEEEGLELESFTTTLIPETPGHITWRIGEMGFDMNLSGRVPACIAEGLPGCLDEMLNGVPREAIRHWAIHPGGRSVLDGVREGAGLTDAQLAESREVLRQYGNMSSATVMFVLKAMLDKTNRPDHPESVQKDAAVAGPGCAMAFGPGLTVESMRFNIH